MYLTQAMLRACNFFLMVTIADRISTFGMPRLLRWVKEIQDAERPKMLGYILNVANRTGGSPSGKVGSQQRAETSLRSNLLPMLSRYELLKLDDEPCLGQIPRLDAVARFLGEDKSVQLDFSRKTSGQPSIDQCLTGITNAVISRIETYNA
jgi:cellulose biosynthesis protein BcsQ